MEAELTIRPARPGDRAAVEHICASTWDWGDYVPDTWDAWLADEESTVIVGETKGQVVALSNIVFQPDGQVWLEGMRVDPAFRRQGAAGRFLDYSIALARDRGARVVRLGTGANNKPVQTLMGRAGMEQVGAYVQWNADPLRDAAQPAALTLDGAAQVQAFLEDSPVLARNHGLYSVGWAWQELSPGCVAQHLNSGQVLGRVAPGGDLAALAVVVPEPEEQAVWVGFADGESVAVTHLVMAIRARGYRLGAQKVRTMVPDFAWLRDAYQAAGYSFGDWEGELWIFERRLNSGLPGELASEGWHDG
jgi:GNAT superfamily N-acetyltransferase